MAQQIASNVIFNSQVPWPPFHSFVSHAHRSSPFIFFSFQSVLSCAYFLFFLGFARFVNFFHAFCCRAVAACSANTIRHWYTELFITLFRFFFASGACEIGTTTGTARKTLGRDIFLLCFWFIEDWITKIVYITLFHSHSAFNFCYYFLFFLCALLCFLIWCHSCMCYCLTAERIVSRP